MSMREALDHAMGKDSSETLAALQSNGLAIASADTMTQAIHDVFCGIIGDHEHPNEKDREQALALMQALGRHGS